MRVYLDTCCLNRLWDDRSQDRVRAEAKAVAAVLALVDSGELEWATSRTLAQEVAEAPAHIREPAEALMRLATLSVLPGEDEERRAAELQGLGLEDADALHVACAESARADVLLTTDDRFGRLAHRQAAGLGVSVRNPAEWLEEGETTWRRDR